MQRMAEEGKTHREIGETLGISEDAVRKNLNAIREYGTKRDAQAGWTEEDDAILIQGRKDGLTGQALTALFPDRSHGTVLNRLHALRAKGLVR
jgi:predicted transcriptional regulator